MSQDLFRAEFGVEVEDGPSFIVSDGAPSTDPLTTAYTDAANIGSWCTDSSTGDIYKKYLNGTGADRWEFIISQTALDDAVGSNQWREPVVVREDTGYANLIAAEAAMNTGTVDGVTVADGDRILYTTITGQSANVFIVTGTPGAGATLVEDTKALEEGDVLSIMGGTYVDEQHYYNGTAWVNTGSDASAELAFIRAFIGKGAAGSELPDYGTPQVVTQNGTLEAAITELDTAVDSNDTDIGNLQTANTNIQTEIDNIEASAGTAINTDGTWNGYTGTNYIDTATSLTDADELLDTEVGAIQTEVNNIETAAGAAIDATGTYVPHTTTNYINANADITEDLIDLDAQILIVDNENVSRFGDTMEPGANIIFTSGGEVLGLPAVPSGATAASSKAYVDSLSQGLVWLDPVWFVDVCSDALGGPHLKDLQTPANNSDAYLDTIENSDILIVASGTNVTWTAVGSGGNIATTTGINAGDGIRWNDDADNGHADPTWEDMGHISDNAIIGSDLIDGHKSARTRIGLDIATQRSPAGTFAGMDNAIIELVIQDFDGNASTTEYDALWAVNTGAGDSEVNTITAIAKASVPAASYFSLYAAVFGPNITGSTTIDPTNVADGGTNFYVWFDTTGTDVDPAPAGHAEGIKVDISGDTTADDVAASTLAAINSHRPQQAGSQINESALWSASTGASDETVVTDRHDGRATAAVDGTAATGFTFTRTATGAYNNPNDAAAFFVSNPDSGNFGNQFTYTNNDWIHFGGGSTVVAGVGLSQSGNVLNVNLGAGIVELPSDEVGVDIRPASGLWTTLDGTTSSTLTGAQLGIMLDSTTLTMTASGIRVNQNILDEINAIETAMGSAIDVNGNYVAHTGTTYINGNTSVTEDLTDLDTAIDANATSIGNNTTAINNLQTEVDLIETSMGAVIDATGAYVPHTGTDYIDGNTTVTEDLTDLDAQIRANALDIITINNNNGDEANIRDFIGKGAAGVETPVYSSTNVVTQNTDLEAAIGELDGALGSLGTTATQLGVTTWTTLDSVLVDDVKLTKWLVHAQQGNKVTAVEIFATHDGQAAVDATDADHTTYAKLKLNGNIAGLRARVTVFGTAGAQIMQLEVQATGATDFNSVRRDLL